MSHEDHEWVNTVIAGLAFLLSAIALWKSSKDTSHAAEISEKRLDVAQGGLELEVQKSIRDAKHRVEDFFSKNAAFLAEPEAGLDETERKRRERLKVEGRAAIEGYLNALDSACRKYIDETIRQDWFKREQEVEIRQTFENGTYKDILADGRFHALKEVQKDWDNPEQGRLKKKTGS